MTATDILLSNIQPPSKDMGRGVDPSGLGRWCSLLINQGKGNLRLVTYYGSSRPSQRQRDLGQEINKEKEVKIDDLSVWRQHKREFKRQGKEWKDQRTGARNDLLQKPRERRRNNEEIHLMGNFNDNLYNSGLAISLADNDIGLKELYMKTYESKASFSHMSGSEPIYGIFTTPGITLVGHFLSGHSVPGTARDHRMHMVDFCSINLVRVNVPVLKRRSTRRL